MGDASWGIGAGLLSVVWGYLQIVWVDASALIGAAVAFFVCRYKRHKKGMPPLPRESFHTVFFSGASVVLLALLAVAAWSEPLLSYMLSQERFPLCAALIFATYDEFLRIAQHWRRQPVS